MKSIIMLIIGLDKVGGWTGLMEKVPEAMTIAKPYDDAVYPFWGILATAFYAGIFYWGIDQVNVQRVLAAQDLKHARWGAMFATLLKVDEYSENPELFTILFNALIFSSIAKSSFSPKISVTPFTKLSKL